jgi:hypothetical protein
VTTPTTAVEEILTANNICSLLWEGREGLIKAIQ